MRDVYMSTSKGNISNVITKLQSKRQNGEKFVGYSLGKSVGDLIQTSIVFLNNAVPSCLHLLTALYTAGVRYMYMYMY